MADERLTEYRHDGLVFDVVDDGPPDGVPVVLLHGFPQRATSWAATSSHLHEQGARTYAPDQRGYSPRARPRSRFAYRATDLSDDVVALTEAIGTDVHLVGHDWGAAVAWAVAARHPESVRTLTAVSVGHPAAFVRSFVRSNQALRSYYMALFQIPFLPEWLLKRHGGWGDRLLRGSGMSSEMVDTYHREIVDAGALRGGLAYYRSLPLTPPGMVSQKVQVPTTYVWSDHDVALGRTAAELTADFVTGPYRFEVMEGASHWIPEERPAELAALIAERAGLPVV